MPSVIFLDDLKKKHFGNKTKEESQKKFRYTSDTLSHSIQSLSRSLRYLAVKSNARKDSREEDSDAIK